MHKYIALFFSATFFLSACKEGKNKGIIDHNRMISLLTEVHIIDGRMYSIKQVPDSLYKYGAGLYVNLFKKYHTDTVQFRKSIRYYSTQPTELEDIYTHVQQKLKEKADSLNKIQIDSNKIQQKLIQAQQKRNNALPQK